MTASCADCDADPAQRDYFNCDGKEGQEVSWRDDISEDEYYVCPIKCIPANVAEWYSEYSYYKSFMGTAPGYNRINPKFIEATQVYEKALSEFTTIARGQTVRK